MPKVFHYSIWITLSSVPTTGSITDNQQYKSEKSTGSDGISFFLLKYDWAPTKDHKCINQEGIFPN
jgi:hypothetical protein